MSDLEMRRIEILDECLTQIQSGGASIADCLKAHPEHEGFLFSHLTIALQTHDLMGPPEPSEEFTARTKIRLMNQVRAMQSKSLPSDTKKPKRLLGIMRPAFAYASLLVAFVLMVSGIGVASASASALPGDLLYGVKLGIEETRLAFSQNPVTDAELLIEFADTRLDEVIVLTEAKRASDVEEALAGYEDIISRIIDLSGEGELDNETETLEKIHFGLDHHQDILRSILVRTLDKASLSANTIKGLQNAIEKSGHGKDMIEYIQNGGSPSDLAPGQLDKDKENQGNPLDNRGGGNDSDRTPGPPPSKTPKEQDSNETSGRPPTKTPKPGD
jgi:hypothetical protein